MTDQIIETPDHPADLSIGDKITGNVKRITVYGVMVDLGYERNALLHVSQVKQAKSKDLEDLYTVGDEIEAFVLKVDDYNRIALTEEKPPSLPWSQIKVGESYQGTVTRIENYGAFVDIGAERPGMVHVSELADGYVQSPNDVVSVNEAVEVRVIKLDKNKRQIDLSMKTPIEEIEQALEPIEDVPTPMEMAFRRAQQESNRKGNKKKRRRNRQQDDIIERTLRGMD